MPREAITCDRDEAKRYIGATESRFKTLCARKIVKSIGRDWYAYEDLDRAIKLIIAERDGTNVLYLGNDGEETEKGRPVGSKGSGSKHRKAEELLFPPKPAGR